LGCHTIPIVYGHGNILDIVSRSRLRSQEVISLAIVKEEQQAGNLRRQHIAAAKWDSRKAEIQSLYIDGEMSQEQLAKRFGVSQQALAKAIKRMGMASKPRSRTGSANGRFVDGSQSTSYRGMITKTRCNKCGSTEKLLVHHIDGVHTNNVAENLEVLCSPCHTSYHKKVWWASRKSG